MHEGMGKIVSLRRGGRDVAFHEEIGGAVIGAAGNVVRAGIGAVYGGPLSGLPGTKGPFGDPNKPPIEIVSGYSVNGNGCCPPGSQLACDPCTGQIYCKKTRRRRKRLLTCSDKADIAFITGTLGKGSLAQTAIASLLAKCG